ncbi:hypothetical protein, partial [Enterobacter hormaechei]
ALVGGHQISGDNYFNFNVLFPGLDAPITKFPFISVGFIKKRDIHNTPPLLQKILATINLQLKTR